MSDERPSHLFKPGQSGNPAGKPKGARHKYTLAAQVLLDGEAEALTRRAIELALAGDTVALRLCLERIVPPRKDRPVVGIEMPALKSASDAVAATAALFDHVAAGDLTPSEAAELGKLVDTFVKSTELLELEQRIARLEQEQPREPVSGSPEALGGPPPSEHRTPVFRVQQGAG